MKMSTEQQTGDGRVDESQQQQGPSSQENSSSYSERGEKDKDTRTTASKEAMPLDGGNVLLSMLVWDADSSPPKVSAKQGERGFNWSRS